MKQRECIFTRWKKLLKITFIYVFFVRDTFIALELF